MTSYRVAIGSYEQPIESVRQVIDLSGGLDHLPQDATVFIKPNIVFWTRATDFPKWGVITTSRIIEDTIITLKEKGINRIIIGEGSVFMDPKDKLSAEHSFENLGYYEFKKRYGIECINVFDRPFKTVQLDDIELNFNEDILNADFVVNIPVLKTHNQTVVSLGIKNLKGMIDIVSRKRCHTMTPDKNLHYYVSKLSDCMPPMLTLIDGIYSNERGPGIDGRMRRSNILIASNDILSADLVGCRVLGHSPDSVPHIVYAAQKRNRKTDLSDVEVMGKSIEDVASRHEFDFLYSSTDQGCLPVPMAKEGLEGIYYRKYDLSMCTYCSGINGVVLSAIRYAWKGKPWDKIEILTGKSMEPTPGMNKTILLGKCMYQKHKHNDTIKEMIPIKGCPPKPDDILKALHQAGIDADKGLFEQIDKMPGFFLGKYQNKPEFNPHFFRAAGDYPKLKRD